MNKKILAFTLISLSLGYLHAEELEADFSEGEKIQLPEVTTVATGDSLVAGKDAVPDFSKIIPSVSDSGAPLPVLPTVTVSSSEDELEADLSDVQEKNVYAEGLIGAGFPGYFAGDFSVYKSSGDNPFLLRFSHETHNGYGSSKARDGFADNNTVLLGEKSYAGKVFSFTAKGSYENSRYALQSKSLAFYDLNYQTVSTDDVFSWKLPAGFALGTSFTGEFYTRYAGIADSTLSTLNQEKTVVEVVFNPSVNASWSNEMLDFGFKASYTLESILSNLEFLAPIGLMEYDGPMTSSINRGYFGLSGKWHNSSLSAGVKAGAVIGDNIGTVPVIVPFCVDFSGLWHVGSSYRVLSVDFKGGLDSALTSYSQYEKKNLFVAQQYLPSETTDWFVSAAASIPAGSFFTIDAKALFRKTAAGNGVWEGDYSGEPFNLNTQLYVLRNVDRNHLALEGTVSYLWNIFTVGATWKSNFLYVPVDECPHKAGAFISFQSDESTWGFTAEAFECIGKNVDLVPVINANAFYKVTDSLRIAVQMDDAIKLFTGSNRSYGATPFVVKAGTVSLQVRFFF